MTKPLLEICCFSIDSALAAQNAGADRIEFCSPVFTNGGSPLREDIFKVKELVKTRTHVMLHPREGNYVYTNKEIDLILEQIVWVREAGCAGIVIGCNTSDYKIDLEKTKILVDVAKGLDITFHKAFDECEDLEKALDDLISLGIPRVLTSGGKKTAMDGIEMLSVLNEMAGEQITIMAGGSLRSTNINEFLKVGIKEVHSSALLSGNVV
ncbi:MAG: copper homeostasis protein CutC, partial [Bacteroidia bacterium]|nr:copper homeostasis protein CutC [Bacteroidia bacterium]